MGGERPFSIRAAVHFGRRRDALVDAVVAGDLAEARALLDSGADPNARQCYFPGRSCLVPYTMALEPHNASTALMVAAAAGNSEMVGLLLARGAGVNACTEMGWSALGRAIDEGRTEIARTLIEHGADVNFKLPLDGNSLLHLAALRLDVEAIELLLEHGADVMARNDAGDTALIEPAAGCSVDIVELLVAAGVDVNAVNGEGRTALYYARENGCDEVVEMLRRAGAA